MSHYDYDRRRCSCTQFMIVGDDAGPGWIIIDTDGLDWVWRRARYEDYGQSGRRCVLPSFHVFDTLESARAVKDEMTRGDVYDVAIIRHGCWTDVKV